MSQRPKPLEVWLPRLITVDLGTAQRTLTQVPPAVRLSERLSEYEQRKPRHDALSYNSINIDHT